MNDYTEDQLWDMSDAELTAAFRESKADLGSPDVDLEQPEMDSDDDTSFDDDADVEIDTGSDADEGDTDEDTDESDDEETEKVATKTEDDEQPVQRRKYKANGKDYEFSDEEIFDKFGHVFGQAMDYTKKMQQIKPWRKTIDAIEEAKLSEQDMSLAIDVLKGDKEAIAELLKRTGVDALELDTDNVKYQPKDYGRTDTELAIRDIVEEIKGDKEYDLTYDVLQNQWDENSRTEFLKNPEMIRQLHIDMKTGMFDIISPIANKARVFDSGRKSDLEYYTQAAQQYFAQKAQEETTMQARTERQADRQKIDDVKTATAKREATKTASTKRKAAAPTAKGVAGSKIVDYLEMNDEAFDDWYSRLQDAQ